MAVMVQTMTIQVVEVAVMAAVLLVVTQLLAHQVQVVITH
jgi:hypothetical protein